jgi:hypothetical protein
MIVHLISGKEEQVRLDPLNILHQIILGDISAMTRVNGVPRKTHRDELSLIDGVLAYYSVVGSFLPMPYAVGSLNGIIPVLHPERSGPTSFDQIRLGDLHPFALAFDLQASLPGFPLKQWVKLSGQLQSFLVNGVQCEANNLITGDLRKGQRIVLFWLAKRRNGHAQSKSDREYSKGKERAWIHKDELFWV